MIIFFSIFLLLTLNSPLLVKCLSLFFLTFTYEEDAILLYMVLTYFTQNNLKFHLFFFIIPSSFISKKNSTIYIYHLLFILCYGCLICINNLGVVNDPVKSMGFKYLCNKVIFFLLETK